MERDRFVRVAMPRVCRHAGRCLIGAYVVGRNDCAVINEGERHTGGGTGIGAHIIPVLKIGTHEIYATQVCDGHRDVVRQFYVRGSSIFRFFQCNPEGWTPVPRSRRELKVYSAEINARATCAPCTGVCRENAIAHYTNEYRNLRGREFDRENGCTVIDSVLDHSNEPYMAEGSHVILNGIPRSRMYIVPTCHNHNAGRAGERFIHRPDTLAIEIKTCSGRDIGPMVDNIVKLLAQQKTSKPKSPLKKGQLEKSYIPGHKKKRSK